MDSWDKFQETKLPPKDQYYSKLTCKGISDEDYEFAQELWNKFQLDNLGDLLNLYMSTDV